MDFQSSGDLSDGFSIFDRLTGCLALLTPQVGRASKHDTTLQCGFSSVFGSASDKFTFELRNAGKNGQDHAARGRGRISPRFGRRLKSRVFLSDNLCDT